MQKKKRSKKNMREKHKIEKANVLETFEMDLPK